MGAKPSTRTVDRILDVAERLVQVWGLNAFSYADVSKALGIRKASPHHHFATKTDLRVALVRRYRRAFLEALSAIESRSVSSRTLSRVLGVTQPNYILMTSDGQAHAF